MARKRTQPAGRAVGNDQVLDVEDLARMSTVDPTGEFVLDGVLIEDADLSGVKTASARFAEVALRRVNLGASELRGLRLLDVLARALTVANGSWPYARIDRVTFESSTLVGLDLSNAQIGRTTFCECKLDLINLRQSSVQDVVFLDCSLRAADFYGANLRSVRFERCDLCEIDFNHATLEQVDLRSSTLTDVRGVAALRGAIVDGSQLIDLAPSLAAELGIQVEYLGERDQ